MLDLKHYSHLYRGGHNIITLQTDVHFEVIYPSSSYVLSLLYPQANLTNLESRLDSGPLGLGIVPLLRIPLY